MQHIAATSSKLAARGSQRRGGEKVGMNSPKSASLTLNGKSQPEGWLFDLPGIAPA